MDILVTGSNGFIGSHTAAHFLMKGENVSTMDRGDFDNHKGKKYDVVINCAASIHNRGTIFEDNVVLVNRIINEISFGRMIQLGSSSEYGICHKGTTEEDPINPHDIYSATKGAATLLCLANAAEKGKNITIVRPYSVYGPGEPEKRFISRLVKAALNKERFTIYPGSHDWIHIEDFVKAIDFLVNTRAVRITRKVFDVGTGVCTPNLHVLRTVEKIFNTKISHYGGMGKYRKYDRMVWHTDSKKMRDLGFSPSIGLEEGIRSYVSV